MTCAMLAASLLWRAGGLAETILKIADESLIADWNKQNPKDTKCSRHITRPA